MVTALEMSQRKAARGAVWGPIYVVGWALLGCGASGGVPSLPVADAGYDLRGVAIDADVQLDGSASYDPGGAALTYTWSLEAAPPGSTARLREGESPAQTRLRPDVAGGYVVSLRVSNGERDSRPDVVMIEVRNEPPLAVAECAVRTQTPDCRVSHGQTANLVGQLSEDAETTELGYQWMQIFTPASCAASCPALAACVPTGGAVSIVGADTKLASVTFPDSAGDVLVFLLEVSDGAATDTACLRYTTVNGPPVIDAASTGAQPFDPDEGQSFQLQTIATDPDPGDTALLSYVWTQVSPASPLAPLATPGEATTSAVVPAGSIDETTSFFFEVTVTDPLGETDVVALPPVQVQNLPP